jgi:hypothetical protein
MAPATVESASPIGIANVSHGCVDVGLDSLADLSSVASQSTVCPWRTTLDIDDMLTAQSRHKIVAKRGAAFTIMVSSS